MDKDQDTESVEAEFDNQKHETTEHETPTVVVKKSSGFFSILLSLVALGLAAFTFYQQWHTPAAVNSSNEIRSLEQQVQMLTDDLQAQNNQQQNTAKQVVELTQQNQRINGQLKSLGDSEDQAAFDNSDNEKALQQLTQQLNKQQNLITQLQTGSNNQPAIAHEELVLDEVAIQKSIAVKVLIQAQMLVDLQNIDQAVDVLEKFLLVTTLDANWKNKLRRLVNVLKQVELPDISSLRAELNRIDQMVGSIVLETVEPNVESRWYDRFVSIRKIDDEANIESSAALIELKSLMQRKLYEARLFLNLQEQNGWENSLLEVAKLIKDNVPKQVDLLGAIESLSQLSLVANIPERFDTESLISELTGLR